MSIKRLNHHAQNFGQMFCGWQLMFDYKRLAELESGTLAIDMLSGACNHNGNQVEALRIVQRLRNWMLRDLKAHKVDVERVRLAELQVEFDTRRQLGQQLGRTSWKDVTPYFIHCTLYCRSRVAIAHREFASSYADVEEWPESYSWIR